MSTAQKIKKIVVLHIVNITGGWIRLTFLIPYKSDVLLFLLRHLVSLDHTFFCFAPRLVK